MSTHHIHLANFLTSGRNDIKAYCLQRLREGPGTTLETFWKEKELRRILDANPDIKIFLDSGAHSLLNAMVGLINQGAGVKSEKGQQNLNDIKELQMEDDLVSSVDRISINQRILTLQQRTGGAIQTMADFSFNDRPDVREYLDRYIAFIKEYDAKGQLMGYVNLDIIYSAEESWKNQQYMESHGLRPIPVYHFGENFKWWQKYVQEYDYIGIGGVAGGVTMEQFVRSLGDPAFKYLWDTDPTTKVHGFAVTSNKLIIRYPFWSVDSTTWLKHAAYGNVMVPRWDRVGKRFDYISSPLIISVSDISEVKESTSQHYTMEYPQDTVDKIHEYFAEGDIDPEKLKTDMLERFRVDIFYYEQLLRQPEIHERRPFTCTRCFF